MKWHGKPVLLFANKYKHWSFIMVVISVVFMLTELVGVTGWLVYDQVAVPL